MPTLRRAGFVLLAGLVTIACGSAPAGDGKAPDTAPPADRGEARSRLFPPDELGLLEAPDRDEWQQPERVMDALEIADGSRVADLGAGGGWFTARLARRVGPNGTVFAEDIQPAMIAAIERRKKAEGLSNVQTILDEPGAPRLPAGLQAVLIVNAYPQFHDPVAILRSIAAALAPNGRLGIIDYSKTGAGGPGPPVDERVAPETVVRDAEKAGLTLHARETFLRYQFMLIFTKR